MALTYIIVVNDNGELKTITQAELDDFWVPDQRVEDIIGALLDHRSSRQAVKAQTDYERGLRDGLSRAREEEFKRGDPGHSDNDMGM